MIRVFLTAVVCLVLSAACRDDRNVLTIGVPARVRSFQITDSRGDVLWRLENGDGTELSEIHYGEVPKGFRQTIPPNELRPRPLTTGERLATETVTDTRTFYHDGLATGPAAFRGEGWRSKPHRSPVPERGALRGTGRRTSAMLRQQTGENRGERRGDSRAVTRRAPNGHAPACG